MKVFECKMCGRCCEGKGGIVVSPQDLVRLADYLKMSQTEVINKFGEYQGKKLKLRVGDDDQCIFFEKEIGCTVHAGKPNVCRAWPFFRGNLVDKESFIMAQDFCPGINPNVSHEDFVREGLRYLEENNLKAFDGSKEANALIISSTES